MAKYLKPDIKAALEAGVGLLYRTGHSIIVTSEPIHTECTACKYVDDITISVSCTPEIRVDTAVNGPSEQKICESGSEAIGLIVQRFIHDELVAPANAHNN